MPYFVIKHLEEGQQVLVKAATVPKAVQIFWDYEVKHWAPKYRESDNPLFDFMSDLLVHVIPIEKLEQEKEGILILED